MARRKRMSWVGGQASNASIAEVVRDVIVADAVARATDPEDVPDIRDGAGQLYIEISGLVPLNQLEVFIQYRRTIFAIRLSEPKC